MSLEVRALRKRGFFERVGLQLRAGEVLGIGGLVGSGRSEVARCLFGAEHATAGEIRLNGRRANLPSPLAAIRQGIILVPEERKTQGLILNHSILANLSLAFLRLICRFRFIRQGERAEIAGNLVRSLRIKTPSLNQEVGLLSGGNQQKVVIGKWLRLNPRICILDQPTRGIDVGAKQEIYQLILDLAQQGTGVIVISDELPELIGLSDRILVMKRGRVTSEFARGEVNQGQLLAAIIGHEISPSQGAGNGSFSAA